MMISDQLQAALYEGSQADAACQLAEADPTRDREFRQKAEEFYDTLSAWLKRQDSMKKYRLLKYTAKRAGAPDKDAYSYEIPSKALKLGEVYPKFFVVMAPFRTGTARFGKRGPKRIIVMPVLTEDALETESGREMAVCLGYIREVFIHEFIHYLDDLRYKDPAWIKGGTAKLEKGKKKAAYYQHPVEFNAFFQGGASEIERHAGKLEPGEFSRLFGRSFKKFRKHYESLMNKNYRRALKDQWKRKYEVRLWQLYQDMLARDREGSR